MAAAARQLRRSKGRSILLPAGLWHKKQQAPCTLQRCRPREGRVVVTCPAAQVAGRRGSSAVACSLWHSLWLRQSHRCTLFVNIIRAGASCQAAQPAQRPSPASGPGPRACWCAAGLASDCSCDPLAARSAVMLCSSGFPFLLSPPGSAARSLLLLAAGSHRLGCRLRRLLHAQRLCNHDKRHAACGAESGAGGLRRGRAGGAAQQARCWADGGWHSHAC